MNCMALTIHNTALEHVWIITEPCVMSVSYNVYVFTNRDYVDDW